MLYRPETEEIEREVALERHDAQEPTLADYARVVWGGRWLILALMALATLTSLVVSVNLPKMFTAQATVMPLGAERAGGLASALSGSLGGALGIENPNDKLLAVLQSRRVAGMAVDALGLDLVFGQAAGRQLTKDEAIEAMQRSIVKVSGGVRGVITVRVQWRDPVLAAAIANATISATGQFLNERSISMNFQVLDEAVPPLKPSGPSVRLNVAMAVLVSAFAGVVLVFVRDYVRALRGRRVLNGRNMADGFENGSRGE